MTTPRSSSTVIRNTVTANKKCHIVLSNHTASSLKLVLEAWGTWVT